MTPQVELIYDLDCPNVQEARKVLLGGFAESGLQPRWAEWDRKSPESPAYARQYGSPTILVDGRDVAGAQPAEGSDCCRVYDHGPGALRGVPSISRIATALRNGATSAPAHSMGARRGWGLPFASLPGFGVALLPVGICPACWPAYAGILGSLGLGFLLDSTYLLPVTVTLFGLAVFALAFRARTRRGYSPFVLGTASVGLVLVFKFACVFDPLVYAGLLGLVVASVWNAWPLRRNRSGSCPKCVQGEPATTT